MSLASPFLSVVIPVYKVEDYLERCVNSVLNQDFKDFEIILVDDGSPDKCPEICDSLAEKDNRITVIHKQNGGLSSARNAGIENAKGEYISFLDSDDAWAEGKLKELIEHVSENPSDMTVFYAADVLPDGEKYVRKDRLPFGVFTKDEYYKKLIENGNLQESACTKLIRTEFLQKNKLTFQDKMISEDTEWMFRLLRCADKITVAPIELFLCTYGREGSISNTAGKKSLSDILKIIRQSVEYYEKNGDETHTKDYELAHCGYLLSIAVGIYGGLDKHDKKELKKEFSPLIPLLRLSNSKKVKLVRMVYSVFGLSITAFVLNTYMRENKRKMLNKEKINE